ncbi:dienelactone hydrolase family protein, partial [Chlamydia psittaci 06-1683]
MSTTCHKHEHRHVIT